MNAIVTKLLNRRLVNPSVNAPKLTPLEEGTSIEIAQTVTGDKIDTNDVWYKTEEGWYVWSGGVELINDQKIIPQISSEKLNFTQVKETFDLLKLIQNNGDILNGDGNEITIAILDTGIYNHRAIQERILPDKSCSFIESDTNPHDINGHGTSVAGIIASDCVECKGIARKSNVINYKVIANSGHVNSDAIYYSIKHIAEEELNSIDIINMSLDINKNIIPYLLRYLDKIQSNGIIIVVAAGQNLEINNIAILKDVIKVGVFDSEKFIEFKKNKSNILYNCLYLNQPIYTCSINNSFDYISSSSAYTALTTGIISNFLSLPENKSIPKQNRLKEIQKFLEKTSQSLLDNLDPKLFKHYKL